MKLLKRYLIFTVLIFLFVCLCGCPYESKCPLSRISKATIDKKLIGKWEPRGEKGKELGMVMIYPYNAHECLIVTKEKTEEDVELMRAFGTTINGYKFLNVQYINWKSAAERKWFFVNYSFSHKRLEWRTVEEKIFKGKKFGSCEELLAFIKDNLNNKSLYPKNPGRPLIRVGK